MSRLEILDAIVTEIDEPRPVVPLGAPRRRGRWVRLLTGGLVTSFAFAGLVVAGAGSASASCSVKPIPSSQVCSWNRSTWTYSYISSYVEYGNGATAPKNCYKFLVTAWNPCALPTQYYQTVCER